MLSFQHFVITYTDIYRFPFSPYEGRVSAASTENIASAKNEEVKVNLLCLQLKRKRCSESNWTCGWDLWCSCFLAFLMNSQQVTSSLFHLSHFTSPQEESEPAGTGGFKARFNTFTLRSILLSLTGTKIHRKCLYLIDYRLTKHHIFKKYNPKIIFRCKPHRYEKFIILFTSCWFVVALLCHAKKKEIFSHSCFYHFFCIAAFL